MLTSRSDKRRSSLGVVLGGRACAEEGQTYACRFYKQARCEERRETWAGEHHVVLWEEVMFRRMFQWTGRCCIYHVSYFSDRGRSRCESSQSCSSDSNTVAAMCACPIHVRLNE